MEKQRIDILKKIKKIAEKKSSYGIDQVDVEFSANNNILCDEKARTGKRILKTKIYSRVDLIE